MFQKIVKKNIVKKVFCSFVYNKIINFSSVFAKKKLPECPKKVISLELALKGVVKNTGDFFKKTMFLYLALSYVTKKNFHLITLKSTIQSLWNNIAAYNFKL